jgi:hypothetical protein
VLCTPSTFLGDDADNLMMTMSTNAFEDADRVKDDGDENASVCNLVCSLLISLL